MENKLKYSIDDIDKETAYRAFTGTSFRPEKRGESYRESYLEMIKEMFEYLSSLVTSKEHQENYVHSQMENYKQRLIPKLNAHLAAKSRCMSAAITGPANFPTRSNEKKYNYEMNKWNDIVEMIDKFKKYSAKGIKMQLPESVKFSQQIEKMSLDIKRQFRYYKEDNANSHWIRPNLVGRLRTFIKNSNKDAIQAILNLINEIQKDMKKPLITKRNSIFKEFQAAIDKVDEDFENITIFENDHMIVIDNKEDERIQITFTDKPESNIREVLKSNGWRWSPKNSVWQRKNTNNGLYNFNKIKESINNV